ncbi:multidrug-resistance type transporter aminotriazole resistance [Yamadazyma tenuis]|nr:multidrug-resistance type transporter aminotriazole resistance [Yamadazyma tenuis]
MAQILCQGSITMSMSIMDVVLKSFPGEYQSSIKVWFMGSFALTLGTFILISGKLGDIYGLKCIFAIGWVWTCLSALLTGLSVYTHSVVFYIICRALQGIGFALLLPCGMGIIGNLYPVGFRKNFVFSIVGAAGPFGAALGALMAAVIAQLSWWPLCFFIISIIGAAFAGLTIWLIPNSINAASKDFKEFDLIGSLIGTTGLILLNIVLNQGPLAGWNKPYIIALLVISVFLIGGFFIYELKFAEYPLLPMSIFNYKIGMVLICIALGWGSFGIWQYYYWIIMLELRNYTPIAVGASYIPVLVLGIVAAMSVAFIIHRTRPSYILFAASLGFHVGCIMLAVTPVKQSYWGLTFGQLFILTWGMDLSFAAGSIILSDFLPKEHQGMAGSLVSTVVNYSVSLFLSLASNIEVETYKKVHSSIKSYRNAIYFGIGISGLGVLLAFAFILFQIFLHDKNDTLDKESNFDLQSETTQVPSDDELEK